jgi:dihydroneopterin aldolase
MNDQILISQLELSPRIGITGLEREKPQRLTVSLVLHPKQGFENLDDRIENTVDYAEVCLRVTALASHSPRNLVETLAEQIAQMLLADFPLNSVEIELRKYILPETEYVAVKIRRDALL